jgi:hypothetical protein
MYNLVVAEREIKNKNSVGFGPNYVVKPEKSESSLARARAHLQSHDPRYGWAWSQVTGAWHNLEKNLQLLLGAGFTSSLAFLGQSGTAN